jgi:DNA-binding CsgD family transcriptional regulator
MKVKSEGLDSLLAEIGSSISQWKLTDNDSFHIEFEDFFLAIAGHPHVGLTLYDTALKKHLWVNQAYLAQCGFDRFEVLGDGHDFLKTSLPLEDYKLLSDLFEEPFQKEKGYKAHYRKKNCKGTYDWYFFSGYPLVDNGPKSKLVLCYIINLSNEFQQIGTQRSKIQILIKHCKDADNPLTAREVEVLEKLVDGLSQKQVADALNISFHTVETHKKRIFKKLNVHSVAALVTYISKLQI